jgi:hypothetical protein
VSEPASGGVNNVAIEKGPSTAKSDFCRKNEDFSRCGSPERRKQTGQLLHPNGSRVVNGGSSFVGKRRCFGWQAERLPYNCRMQRADGREADQIRPVSFELGIAPNASGSVLVAMGNTRVICGVMIEEIVPRWMKEQGVTGGWLTAEYSMLPYSTNTRKPRDITKGRLDGRSTEIQRLIGRSLRAVVDLEKLGPRTMWIDCDVLQADGNWRMRKRSICRQFENWWQL